MLREFVCRGAVQRVMGRVFVPCVYIFSLLARTRSVACVYVCV
jgi:hypothetical protein